MGWNSGYAIMEKQIIGLYDAGVLTEVILDKIMEPFKNTDCDSGGSNGLLSKDMLEVGQIICKTMKPEEYKDAMDNPSYAEGYIPHLHNNEKYLDLFYSIWNGMWKIW